MLLSFVKEFVRNPAIVGSLVPSSRALAAAITAPIDFDRATCIVEYGPGTGVFTDLLLLRRRTETVLVLIEVNHRFAQQLGARYAGLPNVHVIYGSADKTGQYLQKIGVEQVDYVVCGLPFSSLPQGLGGQILAHTQHLLQPAGQLILFQYTLRKKRLFARFFHRVARTHVLRNMPPAYVMVYEPIGVPEPALA